MNISLDYIFKKRDSSSKLSLDRIKLLLECLEHPEKSLKFIHVAGTNGKGSITTMISNILTLEGFKVGKYISPYVDNFYERIQINNQYITEEQAQDVLLKIEPFIEKMDDKPTSFEIIVALAIQFFYENNCDIVCLEVGLGGRFDATNVIENTLVSIISVIDYDHMEYLGNTIEEIAFEKCGIIKPNKITVSYPIQTSEVETMIEAMCKIRNNKHIKIDLNELKNIKKIDLNYSFIYKNKDYILGLNGKHQIYNSLVVIEAINELNNLGYKIKDINVIEAIKNTRFIGRLDKIKDNPLVILDGAHNINGIRSLKEFIKENSNNRKIILVTSMIKGKDHENCFRELNNLLDYVIITEIKDSNKKSEPLNNLENIIKKYNNNYEIIPNHMNAYNKALKIANDNDMVIISGSLYLLSEFYNELFN